MKNLNQCDIEVGMRVIAYDYRIWKQQGSRDINGNVTCWKWATVEAIYVEPKTPWSPGGEMMCDLKFDHLEEVSRKHFLHAIMRYVSSEWVVA